MSNFKSKSRTASVLGKICGEQLKLKPVVSKETTYEVHLVSIHKHCRVCLVFTYLCFMFKDGALFITRKVMEKYQSFFSTSFRNQCKCKNSNTL